MRPLSTSAGGAGAERRPCSCAISTRTAAPTSSRSAPRTGSRRGETRPGDRPEGPLLRRLADRCQGLAPGRRPPTSTSTRGPTLIGPPFAGRCPGRSTGRGMTAGVRPRARWHSGRASSIPPVSPSPTWSATRSRTSSSSLKAGRPDWHATSATAGTGWPLDLTGPVERQAEAHAHQSPGPRGANRGQRARPPGNV